MTKCLVASVLFLSLFLAACGANSGAAPTTPNAASGSGTSTPATVPLHGIPTGVKPTIVHLGGATRNPPKPRFMPEHITIKVGGVVEWIDDEDGLIHTVTEGGIGAITRGGFDSGFGLQTHKGSTFVVKFNKVGVYSYFCQVNGTQGMVGTVTVR